MDTDLLRILKAAMVVRRHAKWQPIRQYGWYILLKEDYDELQSALDTYLLNNILDD